MFLDPRSFEFVRALEGAWTDVRQAWNRSGETRTVLLLDFLRPDASNAAADVAPPEVQAMIRRRTGR